MGSLEFGSLEQVGSFLVAPEETLGCLATLGSCGDLDENDRGFTLADPGMPYPDGSAHYTEVERTVQWYSSRLNTSVFTTFVLSVPFSFADVS